MKKCMLIALITVFTLSVLGTLCFAQTVANTSKKGSLLIFPLVKIGPKVSQDTIITMSNDSTTAVRLHCIWRTRCQCNCTGFDFKLTPSQPISFSAKTGKGLDGKPIPGAYHPQVTSLQTIVQQDCPSTPDQNPGTGELKCWAMKDSGEPISFNWLSGTATIGEDDNASWEYSAWRFQVGYGVANNAIVPGSDPQGGTVGLLRLTGTPTTYDACPGKLIFHFIEQDPVPSDNPFIVDTSYGSPGVRTVNNLLTLVPCKQDCVSDNNTIVRADLWVHNEYENSQYPYACLDCGGGGAAGTPITGPGTTFYSKSLSGTDPLLSQIQTGAAFGPSLQTPSGMITVDGNLGIGESGTNRSGTDCTTSIHEQATSGIPLIGVMAIRFWSQTNSAPGPGPVAGETPTTHGPGQAYITDANGNPTTTEVVIRY